MSQPLLPAGKQPIQCPRCGLFCDPFAAKCPQCQTDLAAAAALAAGHTVELNYGPPDEESRRSLSLDASLYDQRVANDATIRLHRLPESTEEHS